jgi:hypothetical protein
MSMRVTGSSSASNIAGGATVVIEVTHSNSDTINDSTRISASSWGIGATRGDFMTRRSLL